MSNVIQFPRRETVPQGPAGPLDRRNAWWVENCGDFGRDPGGPRGWNAGEGSDHGADPGCFYLAHAIMGAGVRGGALVGGVSTDDYDARRAPIQVAPIRLLATLVHALVLDPADPEIGFPAAGEPLLELWS